MLGNYSLAVRKMSPSESVCSLAIVWEGIGGEMVLERREGGVVNVMSSEGMRSVRRE